MNNTTQEQKLLKRSICITTTLALVGVAFGLAVNSQSIAFEGFYAIIDAIMTTAALLVSRLIMGEGTRRFQYGYWHLEPLVAACTGTLLATTCLYAFVNGIYAFLQGGKVVDFDIAIIYTFVASIVNIVMYIYIKYANKKLHSEFLRIDAQGWLVGGSLAIVLSLGFLGAIFLADTRASPFLPYLDSITLIVLSALLIQMPLRTIWSAMQEVFLVTPVELDKKVQTVMDSFSSFYQFVKYKSYIAKIGRAYFIEINIITRPDFAITSVTTLDNIRQEIANQLAGEFEKSWLTITFTADPKWL